MNKGQNGLKWFIVRKAKSDEVRGVIVDCIKASDIEVAFKWAMEKWEKYISRSHDAGQGENSAYCMFVEPIESARFPAVTMTPGGVMLVTPEEIQRFLNGGGGTWVANSEL